MQRLVLAGRLGLIVGLSCTMVACGKWEELKARKFFKDANNFYTQQDYRRAAAVYEDVIKADPEAQYLSGAYFFLANSYDNLYKPSRAGEAENDEFLQKAIANYKIAAEKDSDPKLRKLALDYLVAAYGPDKLNQPEEAEPVLNRMIQIDPSDPTNYFGLAKLYEDSGRYDEAEQMLIKAREVKPNDPLVYVQLAGYYNRQGEFEKTIEALQARSEREANNPEAFYMIATFYWDKAYRDFRLKDEQKAEYAKSGMVAVDKAIQLNPDYMEAVTYRGLLLRVQALLEKNPARQKELLSEADKMQTRALELRKKKAAGNVTN